MDRPKKVSTALKLLYLGLIIGAVGAVFEIITTFSSITSVPKPYLGITTGITIFLSFAALALFAFFVYKIGKGKNWARILYLVLFLIGSPSLIINFIRFFTTGDIIGIIGFFEVALEAVAIILLFQKKSSEWFNSMKKSG